MSPADRIFEVFGRIPVLAWSSRWQPILNHLPVNSTDRIRRAAQLHIIRMLSTQTPSPFLVIKGPALAELAYPSPLKRHSVDLDILVAPDQVQVWIDHLKRNGFAGQTEDLRTHAMNQIALTGPIGIVEIHWALAMPPLSTPVFETLLKSAQTVTIGEFEVRTLGPLDGAVHLCLHFHQHLGDPSVLMDLALWNAVFGLNADDVVTHSLGWGLGHIAELPVSMIAKLLQSPRPVSKSMEALGDLLIEEYQEGRVLEGEDVEHYIYQLLSMLLLPRPFRAFAHRLFLGPHRVGNLLGKQSWF